jgi:hypothetical protein
VASQTASLYIVHGLIAIEAGQTASSSNDQNFGLKVVVIFLVVLSGVALQSDREVHIIFPTARFFSMGYKYLSISCKIALFAI